MYSTIKDLKNLNITHGYSLNLNLLNIKYPIQPIELFSKKLYTEQLSEEEINELVHAEVTRHKNFIEAQIELINTGLPF
jgi:hypothetical protein